MLSFEILLEPVRVSRKMKHSSLSAERIGVARMFCRLGHSIMTSTFIFCGKVFWGWSSYRWIFHRSMTYRTFLVESGTLSIKNPKKVHLGKVYK